MEIERTGWIVTGSREWYRELIVRRALTELDPLFVVHGDCEKGVDQFAETWCKAEGIHSVKVPARWRDKEGVMRREAGPLRNRFMLELFPCLPVAAFPEGVAKGTKDCIGAAIQRGHRVRIYDARGKFKEHR